MIFSDKWDRIEGGSALEYYKDGSMNSTLFGTGPGQLDYVKLDEKAYVDPSY